MNGKLLFIAGAGLGYLLGTSRGRQDYERLRTQASRIWLDPRVQKVARQARTLANENLPMGEKVGEAIDAVNSTARSHVPEPGGSRPAAAS